MVTESLCFVYTSPWDSWSLCGNLEILVLARVSPSGFPRIRLVSSPEREDLWNSSWQVALPPLPLKRPVECRQNEKPGRDVSSFNGNPSTRKHFWNFVTCPFWIIRGNYCSFTVGSGVRKRLVFNDNKNFTTFFTFWKTLGKHQFSKNTLGNSF